MLLASAAMLLVGCAKEKLGPDAGTGEMVTANFTAQMQGMPQTKSVTDGEGTKANRCVMEIYYKGVLYTRDVKPIEGMKATFTPRLVSNRTYDVLFWADCGGENLADKYYKTNAEGLGLQAVEMKGTVYVANDDARDAFYTTESVPVGQQVSSETFTLTRPFAQVNIITTDAAIIKNANLYPDGVKMVYTAPTKFNLLTETLSKEEKLTVTGIPYEAFNASSAALTLEMDYLFTSKDKSALDIAFEASKTGESTVTSHSFTNIPVQRNYRTNIKGALLTTTGDWTATIVPGWNQPDEEVKYVEAGSVAAANEAFANGATSVKITSVGEETNLYLPQTTEEVTIDFANPDKGVTVKYGPAPTKAAGDKPAAVNIATNDVTKFTVTGISNIVWLAGNQTALASALNNAAAAHTVVLTDDITMTGEWTPVTSYSGIFDGKNHIINNLKVSDYSGDYIGFFSAVSGATIKNVTFKNATVTNAVSNEGACGAVIVGWSYAGVIDNCHVINSSVTGGQKVAGIVGCISVEGAASKNEVTNCSVEGLTLSSNIPNVILYQAGALVGYMQLVAANPNGILIENNTVKDITINDAFNGPDNKAWYCGTFIGSIIRKQQVDGQKIVLNNNTISGTNTELYKSMYSSEYFGWTSNAEEYSGAIAPILIDGVEWNPAFYMDAEGKYHVTNLDALKYFRDQVNGGKTFDGKTVLLDADIDMAGEAWIPTSGVIAYPGTSFYGTFDGQNHTISNLTCTDNQENYACAGLFGSIYGTIQNLKMTNVNINSTHYAGAIAAYSSSNGSKIINCSVIGGTITSTPEKIGGVFDNGDKVGAIMGYNGEGGTVDNCYVEGVTITAYRDLGAIVGAGGVNKTTNNKAKNCTLIVDRTNYYGEEAVNANPIVGRNLGGTLNANNTFENVTVSIPANTADAIRTAVKSINAATSAGAYTITIANGTYELSDIAIAENAKNKTVIIKAATKGGVTLKMNSDTKSKQIFLVDGYSGNNPTYSLIIDGIKFDLTQVTSGSASVVYAFQATDALAGKIGYTTDHSLRYAHHITIQNCELKGAAENSMMFYSQGNTSPNNIVVKDCSIANVGYLFTGYCDTFTASNVTATNVKHFINNQGNGIVAEDCTVDCYTDYAIRVNAGPVSITGSTFVMTYTGADNGGVFVNRRPDTQLTMTGNTYPASYAGTNMHDIYNDPDDGKGGDCILNGSITINVGESYDFPRD